MEPVRQCGGKNGLLNMLTTLVMKINKNPLLGIPIPYIDFGDGRKIECIDSAKIQAIIVSHKFDMVTNVVDSDVSLFSKSSMKRANMKLKF